ncbi:hypothetical protein GA0115243_10801, partial [Streptomyces sp. ScaeMP-e83]
MSAGVASDRSAIEAPTATIDDSSRCATEPAVSRTTVTACGSSAAARASTARASRAAAGSVAAVTARTRRTPG